MVIWDHVGPEMHPLRGHTERGASSLQMVHPVPKVLINKSSGRLNKCLDGCSGDHKMEGFGRRHRSGGGSLPARRLRRRAGSDPPPALAGAAWECRQESGVISLGVSRESREARRLVMNRDSSPEQSSGVPCLQNTLPIPHPSP